MKFSEEILEHAECNNLIHILQKLRNIRVGIWGTGQAGGMIFSSLEKNGIHPVYFIDGDSSKIGKKDCGNPIINADDIQKDDCIIIAANVRYGIHEQLKKKGVDYIYIDPVSLLFYDKEDPYYVRNQISYHQKEIDKVFDFLEDSYSKQVYYNILLHRAIHDLSLVWNIYDENQYFGNRIVQKASGNFVDCGAYQGDTLVQFMKQIGGSQYKYFAFEADENNFERLTELYKQKKWNVEAYNLGVWNDREMLYFQNDAVSEAGVSGKVVENVEDKTVKVSADSLDHVLVGKKVDFIKMDIEGAEIKALQGTQKIIKDQKPVLAISAYHELNHLWEVPMMIKEMNEEYKLYFAHHMWNMADTVCYGML